MPELNLTQAEADRLIAMEKKAVDQREWTFPGPADRIVVPLISGDKRENFNLDVTRYQIKLTKATFQNRARVAIILCRLDIDGAPHRNPDGEEISCPHLHVYREGFGDKWAVAAPGDRFPDTSNLFSTLFLLLTPSCSVAISPNRRGSREGCSHDDVAGDRAAFDRLPGMAQRQNHVARGEWRLGRNHDAMYRSPQRRPPDLRRSPRVTQARS